MDKLKALIDRYRGIKDFEQGMLEIKIGLVLIVLGTLGLLSIHAL